MTVLRKTRKPQRTFSTGYRGFGRAHSLEDLPAKGGIGIWVSVSICWAQRYAERKAARVGGSPHVQEVTYALANPLELGDMEEPATDDSLQGLADVSGIPFEKICELRCMAGWSGKEFEEPCLFEITNTPDFIALTKSRGYDGMIGWENGDASRVCCIFDKKSIESVKDITDTIPQGWWCVGNGEGERGLCQSE